MPKSRRLPTAEDKDLLDDLKATITAIENYDSLRSRRQRLILEANRRGLSARTLAEVVDRPEGTLINWVTQARADEADPK